MARYNTFKYGDGTKYGTSPVTTNLLWSFIVKWDDEFYTGENEGTRMTGLNLTRGREHLIMPLGLGLERYKPGKATVILDNDDRRYDPRNTNSPLYPNVEPGKFCILRVKDGNTGTNYDLMHGRIADIQPYNDRNRKKVKIEVVDGLQLLADRTFRIGQVAEFVSIKSTVWKLIAKILTNSEWPEDEWPFYLTTDFTINTPGDTSREIPRYYAWQKVALNEINLLEDVELGVFFHTREGKARLVESSFTQDSTIAIDETELLTDISVPQPWETLRNKVEVAVHPLASGENGTTYWSLGTPLFVADGDIVQVEALFREGSFEAAGATDGGTLLFTANSQSDGGGSNLTSGFGASYLTKTGDIGSYFDSGLADGTIITFNNNSGTDGYVTSASFVAGPSSRTKYVPFVQNMFAQDDTSVQNKGARTLWINTRWNQELNYAKECAEYLRDQLKVANLFPTIKVQQRPSLQYTPDLYVTAIDLTIPTLDIDQMFRVGKIQHRWLSENGQSVETTFTLEPKFDIFEETT